MERNTIIEMAKKMETKEDLLILLNRIKHDEMEEMGMSDKFQLYPTTTGISLYANEIFLNTEINSLICGEYLPVLNVKTPLSESWASIRSKVTS